MSPLTNTVRDAGTAAYGQQAANKVEKVVRDEGAGTLPAKAGQDAATTAASARSYCAFRTETLGFVGGRAGLLATLLYTLTLCRAITVFLSTRSFTHLTRAGPLFLALIIDLPFAYCYWTGANPAQLRAAGLAMCLLSITLHVTCRAGLTLLPAFLPRSVSRLHLEPLTALLHTLPGTQVGGRNSKLNRLIFVAAAQCSSFQFEQIMFWSPQPQYPVF